MRLRQRLYWEFALMREYARLVRRAPVKFVRQAIRDYSLRFSKTAPGWQSINVAFRIIDDIADGERTLVSGFSSFPDLIAQSRRMVSDRATPADVFLLKLLDDAVRTIEQHELHPGETRASTIALLNAMLVEYHRRVNRSLFTKHELIEIHIASSLYALNLIMICAGSRNRATEFPALAEFIGRMGTLRDLEHELRLGIINIPREVLPANPCLDELIAHPEQIHHMPGVSTWIQEEARAGLQLEAELRQCELDPWARRVTQNQIARYIRYAQQHSHDQEPDLQ